MSMCMAADTSDELECGLLTQFNSFSTFTSLWLEIQQVSLIILFKLEPPPREFLQATDVQRFEQTLPP